MDPRLWFAVDLGLESPTSLLLVVVQGLVAEELLVDVVAFTEDEAGPGVWNQQTLT